jgi:hypothetical protein
VSQYRAVSVSKHPAVRRAVAVLATVVALGCGSSAVTPATAFADTGQPGTPGQPGSPGTGQMGGMGGMGGAGGSPFMLNPNAIFNPFNQLFLNRSSFFSMFFRNGRIGTSGMSSNSGQGAPASSLGGAGAH